MAGDAQERSRDATVAPSFVGGIGFQPELNTQLPVELGFRDENGSIHPLEYYVSNKPAVLVPAYYSCAVLCDQTLSALASSLRTLSLGSGEDFQVIAFSIDPEDTPATAMAKRKAIVPRYSPRRPVSGWHFLTGAATEIQKLTEALRFRYTYNEKNHTYGHASGIVILTPAGRVSRHLPGIDFSPEDLRLSLVEASSGRIGSIVDRVILYCYQYNPATGRYGAVVMRILWLAAFLTLAGIVLCVLAVQRRERRQRTIGREA